VINESAGKPRPTPHALHSTKRYAAFVVQTALGLCQICVGNEKIQNISSDRNEAAGKEQNQLHKHLATPRINSLSTPLLMLANQATFLAKIKIINDCKAVHRTSLISIRSASSPMLFDHAAAILIISPIRPCCSHPDHQPVREPYSMCHPTSLYRPADCSPDLRPNTDFVSSFLYTKPELKTETFWGNRN